MKNKILNKLREYTYFIWLLILLFLAIFVTYYYDVNKKNQILVGFALENNNELSNAINKLEKKNLDLIVLNSLNDEGAGFGYDTNKITVVDCSGNVTPYKLKKKNEVADDVFKHIIELM